MKEKIAILAAIVALFVAGYCLVEFSQPVHAASSKPDACELVGTTGAIVVYFCQPDNGPDFLVNNIGFMQVVE